MLRKEECDVLHELLSREVIVAGHLQGAEHLVQEALVEMHGDQAEEVGVQQREHLVPLSHSPVFLAVSFNELIVMKTEN